MTDDPEAYDALTARHVSMRRVLALFAPLRARIAGVMALMVLASGTHAALEAQGGVYAGLLAGT